MGVMNYKELLEHLGHDVEVVDYTTGGGRIVNVAIECNDCQKVLIDFDNDEYDEFIKVNHSVMELTHDIHNRHMLK